jgi:2-oxoglutarate dehydrogenase E2 component (dihydrolipoamide succinyltransferase)
LVELETDKVTLEVNAAQAGVLSEVLVQAGENVEVGAVLGRIGEATGAQPPAAEATAPEAPTPEATAPSKPEGEAVLTPQAGNGAAEEIDLVVPALGESVSEATVARWLKGQGEAVAADEPLVELETDKVTLEVNAPAAGVLSEIKAAEGVTVEVGAHLGVVLAGATGVPAPTAAETGEPAPTPCEAGKPAPAVQPTGGREASLKDRFRPELAPRTGGKITKADLLSFLEESTVGKLGPAVRKLVEEKGLDPAVIPASGPDGRVTKGDVLPRRQDTAAAGPRGTSPRDDSAYDGCTRDIAARRGPARGAGQDDQAAPDRRPAAEGSAEHGGDAHHLQRDRHERHHGAAQALPRELREEARREARFHVFFHQGRGRRRL